MTFTTLLTFILWDVNPDIFTIPYLNHPVRWYGVSWALGFVLSQQIMYYLYTKENRLSKEVDDLTIYMVIGAIIGARLGHVLFYDPVHYLSHPWYILAVWEGGLASHGGGLGVIAAAYFFTRKTKTEFLWLLDKLAIVGALTGSLIRLGNLMNSEVVGLPTDVPWAFIFTRVDDLPRHPAQLYEAIYCFILFVILFGLWYAKREQLPNGFIAGVFLVILFTFRFIDEYFKVNQSDFEEGMVLNMGQLLSIPYVLLGIGILVYGTRKRNKEESLS